jgi:hypothetical protein
MRAARSISLLGALAGLIAPGLLGAEPWGCSFTVECVAGEACGESAFDAQVIPADHADEVFLSSVTGDSLLVRLTEAGALPATYASAGRDGLAELLTIEADRTALMSVHFFDGAAQAATYFGTCEELR